MYEKNKALQLLSKLIKKFHRHESEYTKNTYLEYSVRSEFIDKLFEIFNWDVYNLKNLPPNECEVIRENHVSDENNKRVDYTFNINGGTKFLVEAKKPSEELSNPNHIFQAKSYAFSMGTNIVILTNFKELTVYDLKVKPLFNQPEVDRVGELSASYLDYEKTFDRLWEIFEYNNVLKGSLEDFYYYRRKGMSQEEIEITLRNYNQKGVSLLNKAFLEDLLVWREKIAKNIYFHNKTIDVNLINEIVQTYINRVVFLRILEDRKIEGYDILYNECKAWDKDKDYSLKQRLEDIVTELNKKYNGMIFKKNKSLDEIFIDDEIIYSFIMSLYMPQSPYNFSIIDIDILGKIFEQYLGYTISINNGNLKVEYKDEEKKSSGIYYTRQEIVDKIIEETVIPSINKIDSVEKLKKYKVLDISCGSGAFIIEAYRAIVNRYQEIFKKMIEKGKEIPKEYYFIENNELYLSMFYKKEVAISNIYGVDIDPQAIEIAKMSVYILMLEMNYKDDTIRPILPALDENFKIGNSIISDDYYEHNIFDSKKDRVINPFNYRKEFSEIFEEGGFDTIIGNPPYVKIQTLNKYYPEGIIDYISAKYPDTAQGNYDLYVVFVEKALSLLKSSGNFGMIILNTFFKSDYGEGLRKLLSDNNYVKKIIDFGDIQVFDNSTVYTCLLYLQKSSNKKFQYFKVTDYDKWKTSRNIDYKTMESSMLSESPWYFSDELYDYLNQQIFSKCQTLNDITEIFGGVQPLTNKIYLLTVKSEDDKYSYCYNEEKELIKLEKDSLRPIVKGSKDIYTYYHKTNKRLIFPYDVDNGQAELIEEEDYSKRFPETYKYLKRYESILSSKHKENSNSLPWYRFKYVKNHAKFEQQKILAPSMMFGSRFSFDKEGEMYITSGGTASGGGRAVTLLPNCDDYDYYSLLGILNSSVISYLIVRNGDNKKGGWQGFSKRFLEELPIPKISSNIDKMEILGKISTYTRTLSDLHRQPLVVSESQNERIKKRIIYFTKKIDELVCNLYGIDIDKHAKIIEFLKAKL